MKIWLDVETAPGVRAGPGPVVTVTAFASTARLDRAGQWSATVPALDVRAVALLQPKRTALAYAMIDGVQTLLGGGPIDGVTVSLSGDAPSLTVTGADLLGELAALSVGRGESYHGWNLLLASKPASWLLLQTETLPVWYMRYSHESILGALVEAAARVGFHFRLGMPGAPGGAIRVVEAFITPAASGVLATANGDALAMERNPNACAISSIEERRGASDLANRLYVYGSGNGDARLTLAAATAWPNGGSLAGTYTDADGNVWSISRAQSLLTCTSSVAAYGAHDAPLAFANVAPLTNTAADMQAAANLLLLAALQQGRRLAQPQYAYSLRVAGLRKQVRPGQTIRVQARRFIDGARPINIDRDLVVMEVQTAVDAAGIRTDGLTVSTLAAWPQTDAGVMAGAIREVQAAAALPQMGPSVDTISYREPIDDDHPATLPFWAGPEVTTVAQVLLRFRADPLRSTTKTVAGTVSGTVDLPDHEHDVPDHQHKFLISAGTPTYALGFGAAGTSGGLVSPAVSSDFEYPTAADSGRVTTEDGGGQVDVALDLTSAFSLQYGIYEDTNAYAATELDWLINGVAVGAAATSLGSGWYSLDLTALVSDAATFRPARADNTITVAVKAASKNGRRVQVTAQVSLRTVIQAKGYRA